jgi:hypothetical protein
MKSGHIYLLKNSAYRDNYHKLGKTADTVEKRAKKLSRSTGVPSEFVIVYQHRVVDCDAAENMAKQRLKNYRVADTEFFDLPQNEAIKILMEVVSVINTPSDNKEENPFVNCVFENIRDLFETGQARSLSGEAFKIQIFYFLSPAYSRASFTLKEFVDKTGIPENRVMELLKQLNIRTENQIFDELKRQEEKCHEMDEEIRKG